MIEAGGVELLDYCASSSLNKSIIFHSSLCPPVVFWAEFLHLLATCCSDAKNVDLWNRKNDGGAGWDGCYADFPARLLSHKCCYSQHYFLFSSPRLLHVWPGQQSHCLLSSHITQPVFVSGLLIVFHLSDFLPGEISCVMWGDLRWWRVRGWHLWQVTPLNIANLPIIFHSRDKYLFKCEVWGGIGEHLTPPQSRIYFTPRMFNATLAGHHLRAEYNNSRGGSRAASRFDINEVGRCQVRWQTGLTGNVFTVLTVSPPSTPPHCLYPSSSDLNAISDFIFTAACFSKFPAVSWRRGSACSTSRTQRRPRPRIRHVTLATRPAATSPSSSPSSPPPSSSSSTWHWGASGEGECDGGLTAQEILWLTRKCLDCVVLLSFTVVAMSLHYDRSCNELKFTKEESGVTSSI